MARKTKTAPAATTEDLFTLQACRRLRKIRVHRRELKAKQEDLVRSRKKIEKDLAKADKESPDFEKLNAAWSKVVHELKGVRDDIRFYADKYEDTIDKADQPGLWEDDEDLTPPPRNLYGAGGGDDDDDDEEEGGDDRPVGEPGRAADPDAPAWHRHSVKDIKLPDRAVAALVQAEVFVLGDIAGGKSGRLTTYKGVTPGDEAYVDKVVAAFEGGAKDLASAIAAAEQAVLSTKGRK
jgi:hypothetical protein